MAAAIPTSELSEAVAGDTWTWSRAQSADYAIADGWDLSYAFRGADDLDLGAEEISENGDSYDVEVPASKTSGLRPGAYRWAAYVTNADGKRHRIDSGTMRVLEDLQTAESGLSFNERELALVEQQILEITESGTSSIQLNGRATNKLDLPTLHKRRNVLLSKIRSQRTGEFSRQVQVTYE